MDAASSAEDGPVKGLRTERTPWHAVYGVLVATAAVLPWVPRWVATLDGAQHVRLSAFLIEMRTDPSSPLHAVYHDSLGLVTGSSFTWFAYGLHAFLSVENAERVWLSLCVAGFGWMGWLVTTRLHPGAPARALLLAPLLINGFTTSGFLPFLASVPLAAAACLLLLRRPRGGRASLTRAGVASLLLVGCCLGHVASLTVAFALVMALFLWRRLRWTELLRGVVVFLPATAVALHSARVVSVGVSSHQTPMSDVIQTRNPIETFGHFFIDLPAGVGTVDHALQVLALGASLVLLATGLLAQLEWRDVSDGRAIGIKRSSLSGPMALLALLALALLLLPTRFAGWSYASARVIPFILLLLPAAVWWPTPGSAGERRLAAAIASTALIVLVAIGVGWRRLGEHLDNVAKAASAFHPGSRVLPLVFEPGPEASPAVRAASSYLGLHSWAIPTKTSRSMVSFGFENMRRLMLVARADARPPFPPGPDEFAARTLWNSEPRLVRVFADFGLSLGDITDDARLLLPKLADPHFYEDLREALLDHAFVNFHYLLAVDPPRGFLNEVARRGWACLYDRDGVYVYRLGLDPAVDTLRYAEATAQSVPAQR
jgi:hypothetical protein